MKKHINTFNKGLNRDCSKNKFPNDCYYNAEGLRLITNDGLSSFALTNIEGNTLSASLDSGWTIHGQQAWCVLRDSLIILAIGSTPGTNDRIYKFTIASNGSLSGGTVLYTGNLGFNSSYKIKKLIGVFESDTIQKIYWTDALNGVKFCNIADSTLSSYPSTKFDRIPVTTQAKIVNYSISSGSLKAGCVQYSYQLYNFYGAQTEYFSPSQMIGLSFSAVTTQDYTFTGGKEGDNSGKSVSFQIASVDTNFNRIRVVRIHHTSLLADPTITIIAELPTSSTISIVDTGTINLGEVSVEEFSSSNYAFICEDLETKNNILFAAGITESVWDVDYDARAYRYNEFGNTSIYDENLENPISFTYSQLINGQVVIPEKFACRDPYNRPFANPWEVYQGDGATLGGEGINIKYGFYTDYEIIDNFILAPVVETTGSINKKCTDGVYKEYRLNFHRDEIYSLAIIFLNEYGQKSYPKWITDVRIPKAKDKPLTADFGRFARSLKIKVEVKNMPTEAVAYQIVRCERTSDDRTILAQGLVGATREFNSYYCAEHVLTSVLEYFNPNYTNRRLVEFISPEICFNKNLKFTGGDYLDYVGYVSRDRRFVKIETDTVPFVNLQQFDYETKVAFVINKLNLTHHSHTVTPTTITDAKVAEPLSTMPVTEEASSESIVVGRYSYENYTRRYGRKNLNGNHGTAAILQLNSDLDISGLPMLDRAYVMYNYKSQRYPYGGPSYSARQQRTYIACSNVTPVSYTVPNIIYAWGDTYISKFEYLRTSVNPTDVSQWFAEVYIFPVETSIDTRWRSGTTFTQEVTNLGSSMLNLNAVLKQEKAGVYAKDAGKRTYVQENNLYSYNSVYSKPNNLLRYYPKPVDINLNSKFDARVIYSDRKFNNELTDSFTKFKPLNFKDVDSQYGPINALTNYNTDLLFFQDTGWGVLSVEERELLPGSNGTQLTTGTGGILSRFDYISTNGGCEHPNSIFRGRYSMYFYDKMNNSLFSFLRNGGDNNLSKLLGVQSFLNKNITGSNLTDVITGYNPKYNEVMFTFSANTWSDGDYKTIIYNEKDKQFTRIDPINPTIYINLPDYLHETTDNLNLHQRNIGNFGQFFGTYVPSKLVILVNPDGVLVNRFDIIQWITEFTNNNHKTFDTIRFYNDYQDSGIISLVQDSNLFYVFRTWRFNQFFDSSENRIKDSYMLVELTYNNASNDKLVIHDIITTYSPTAPF